MIDLMIADDNVSYTQYLANMLTKEKDIKVINICYDGLSTIENYNKLKPDVLLLDLEMPGCSGIDVLEKIQTYTKTNNIIVISGSEEWRARVQDTSKFDWSYHKTVDISQLLKTIRNIKEANTIPEVEEKLNTFFNDFLFDDSDNAELVKKAILTIYNYPDIEWDKTMKVVAATKQIKNSKTAYQTINRCVNKTIRRHNNFDEFNDVLPLAFRYNPTPKNFIKYMAKYLEKTYK